jgi:hypothetical protein
MVCVFVLFDFDFFLVLFVVILLGEDGCEGFGFVDGFLSD